MSYAYNDIIFLLKNQGYELENQDYVNEECFNENWVNRKDDLRVEFCCDAGLVEDVNSYSWDYENMGYSWDFHETDSFIKALDLKLLNDSLETDGEQLDKRINRTKDVMIENINLLYDVEFDLNYYSDYILDENLKEANRYVILAIEKVRNFMEGK